jgi:hypothetical protein
MASPLGMRPSLRPAVGEVPACFNIGKGGGYDFVAAADLPIGRYVKFQLVNQLRPNKLLDFSTQSRQECTLMRLTLPTPA